MNEALEDIHLINELEIYLTDNCPGFYDVIVTGKQVIVSVSGDISAMDKQYLVSDIRQMFSQLTENDIQIMDDQDRLDSTDTERRNLETKIRKEVADLVRKGEIGVNDLDNVWLRFNPITRLMRYFSFDAKGVTMKASLDPDSRKNNYPILLQIARKYGLPLKITGTTLWRNARREVEIEKASKHII